MSIQSWVHFLCRQEPRQRLFIIKLKREREKLLEMSGWIWATFPLQTISALSSEISWVQFFFLVAPFKEIFI